MPVALTVTTADTTLEVLQRKVQGSVQHGIQTMCPEWRWMQSLPSFDLDHSYREVTQPIVIERQGGGAFIPDFGFESVPRTRPPRELTFTFTNYNDRFTISIPAQKLDRTKGVLEPQAKYQVKRMAEGACARVTRTIYGYSTGLVAQTSTDVTSATPTLTLINAFGLSEPAADNAAFLADMFDVDDRVAIVRAGAILTGGLATVTAKTPATPSITLATDGGASVNVDANDELYYAQSSQGDVASTDSCDLNKWPPGWLDATTSTSLHNLSGSTYPLWTVALNDTSGGRINYVRILKGMDEIGNRGGGQGPWKFVCTQGIYRDIVDQQTAAIRFDDPGNMKFDGAVTTPGLTRLSSRFVPPGRAWLFAKGATKKWPLGEWPDEQGNLPAPGDQGWMGSGIDKIENRNGHYVSVDFSYGLVTKRNDMAAWSGLTES